MTRPRVKEDAQLAECPAKKALFELPFPVDERLESLTEIAPAARFPTSRKDLVSALILDASEKGEELVALMTKFRRAPAKRAAVGTRPDSSGLVERAHEPGPRRLRTKA